MPTPFSHPAVPLALAVGLGRRAIPWRLLLVGVIAAVLPDADVLAFRFGIPYADAFGHRGATHSLAFAALLGLVASACHAELGTSRRAAFLFAFSAAASHALLDACTDGGLGVALLWPASARRFFASFRPIHVAPISARRLFGGAASRVLGSEARWVWLPCGAAAAVLWRVRRSLGARTARRRSA